MTDLGMTQRYSTAYLAESKSAPNDAPMFVKADFSLGREVSGVC
jgi:hypothetical protein